MRATIRYMHDEVSVPNDAKLGDTFTITAQAVVTGIENELIDLMPYGKPLGSEHILGESSATITLGHIHIEPVE